MSSVSAGWYPDPSGRYEQRFFDGNQWTAHVARGAERLLDAPATLVPAPVATLTAPYSPPVQVQIVTGNGASTAALVLGILGLLFSLTIFLFFIAFPLALLGFIFGLVGRSRASETTTNVGGGKAIAGIITGLIGAAISTICFLALVAFVNDVADDASTFLASDSRWDVAVVKVTDPAPQPKNRTTTAGTHLVAIELRATNRNDTLQRTAPGSFHLEDAAGHQFVTCFMCASDGGLRTPVGGVARGETISGVIYFEVTDGVRPTTLVWDPFGAGATHIPLTQ